ncbi:cupin domain-containing protein [Chryseobacterium culicis]|uniref:(S)-ureidoglycine aminohydrolase cupin domain-containing protein n=1 Tax=Chryseobacterium culicis TaxID=680127 RepID=A0A1H6H6V0_CHRCI|nr:cupin domain-containing protein [Chryseobacterium culicis]SEH31587.1 hypothetical protein SAMN05421593_1493 [Chryseobacterium culicis]
MIFITKNHLSSKSPKVSYLDKSDLIYGNPEHRSWILDEAKNGAKFGIWESQTGKWKFSINHWEYCRILEGKSIITDQKTGKSFTVKAGDSFVLQPGFSGIWEALEKTKKEFIAQ